MGRIQSVFSSALLLYAPSLLAVPPREFKPLADKPVAFVGASVLPMDSERVLTNQTVVIRNGRIAEIGPADRVSPPADSVRIEARGGFLIPGLSDMHVHLFDPADFVLLLANGVTTVCNMAGAPMHLEWRTALCEGSMLGPMLYSTGPMVEGKDEPVLNTQVDCRTPRTGRKLVEHIAQAGYDLVKIHGDPPRNVYDAVMAGAREHGLRVVGHGSERFPLSHCLEAGQSTIEHAEEFIYCHFDRKLDAARLPEIVELTRKSGAYVTPTLICYSYIGRTVADIGSLQARPELASYARWKQFSWGPEQNRYLKQFAKDQAGFLTDSLEFQKRLVRSFSDAGVPIMTGTDYGGPPFLLPGFDLIEEIRMLVDCGLSPWQALQAATRTPGLFFGGDFGTIAVGQRADLVLLAANPVQDVLNLKQIRGVTVRGRWLPRRELDAMVEQSKKRHETETPLVESLLSQGSAALRSAGQSDGAGPNERPLGQPALIMAGYIAIGRNDLPRAESIFELMSDWYPDSYISFDLLGKAQVNLGKHEAARVSLQRAVQLNPHDFVAADMLKKLKRRG